jgi:hypothetical protein
MKNLFNNLKILMDKYDLYQADDEVGNALYDLETAINYELRVYAYDVEATDENFELIPIEDITDEEFMEEAEKQGRVYTLKGFEKALNETGEINTNTDIIRFIQVPVSE